jgi:hypothetical protein
LLTLAGADIAVERGIITLEAEHDVARLELIAGEHPARQAGVAMRGGGGKRRARHDDQPAAGDLQIGDLGDRQGGLRIDLVARTGRLTAEIEARPGIVVVLRHGGVGSQCHHRRAQRVQRDNRMPCPHRNHSLEIRAACQTGADGAHGRTGQIGANRDINCPWR